jgi:hypothetical protein
VADTEELPVLAARRKAHATHTHASRSIAGRVEPAPPGLPGSQVIGRLGLVRLPEGRTLEGAAFVMTAHAPASRPQDIFPGLSPDEEATLAQAVLAITAESRTATVLIVAADPGKGEALREATAALGHQSFAVRTPLEAACALKPPNRFSSVILDAALAESPIHRTNPRDLLRYLAEQHPDVRRVLMNEPLSGDALARALVP